MCDNKWLNSFYSEQQRGRGKRDKHVGTFANGMLTADN